MLPPKVSTVLSTLHEGGQHGLKDGWADGFGGVHSIHLPDTNSSPPVAMHSLSNTTQGIRIGT